MGYLLLVSAVWAFSFGLIKDNLTGLDSNLVAAIRLLLSMIVFLPFLRVRQCGRKVIGACLVLGMVQYGLMYAAYIHAFQFLNAYQVALFTIFTPFYIAIIDAIRRRRLQWLFFVSALGAVCGMAVVVYSPQNRIDVRSGFILMQFSNMCFAYGQIVYRDFMHRHPALRDTQVFGLLYMGGFLVTGCLAGITTDWSTVAVSVPQIITLLYLGVVSSGVCFFVWNVGARKADVGALAVFNNIKVPLAVACSLLFFQEQVHVPRLIIGGLIIAASLFFNEWIIRRKVSP